MPDTGHAKAKSVSGWKGAATMKKKKQEALAAAILFCASMFLVGCQPDRAAARAEALQQCRGSAMKIPTAQADTRGGAIIQCMKAGGFKFNYNDKRCDGPGVLPDVGNLNCYFDLR
jgi:hypothetical protein